MTTPERRNALAAQIEQTAADDGFAALAAVPRPPLDQIAGDFKFQLVVARAMRKQATS